MPVTWPRNLRDWTEFSWLQVLEKEGIEGKIEAIRYARENKLPFFGICLGMQMATIEYSRNVLGYADANSTEMNPNTKHPVVNLMEDQKNGYRQRRNHAFGSLEMRNQTGYFGL